MEQLELFETENESKLRHINELKFTLRSNLDEGCHCMICGQYAQIYKRNFSSAMSVALIKINQAFQDIPQREWLKVEDYLKAEPDLPSTIRGDFPKAVHWGLIERQDAHRDDGSKRVGYYRMTQKGVDFIFGTQTIPRWVKLYNGRVMGWSEDHVNIRETLQEKFDYDKLMNREPWKGVLDR